MATTRLVFPEIESVLRRWQGREVRVDFTHHASAQHIATVPQSVLQRVDPMPEDETGLAGDGVGLTFSGGDGATIFTLLVHEQHLHDAVELDRGLEISLHDLEVVIEAMTET